MTRRPLAWAAALLALAPAGAAAAGSPTRAAHEAGVDAWVYGYPPLVHAATQAGFPADALVGVAALQDASSKLVVQPNVDTAYTVGRLDLRAEPLVLHVPALRDRYYVLQLMDAFTDVFGYVGSRVTGVAAGDYAITAPGWSGVLPAGVRRISAPTPDVLLLGRTLVRDRADLPAVRRILASYTVTPLSRFGEPAAPSLVLDSQPVRARPVLPTGTAFLDALDARLAQDPPPAADAPLLRRLRRYGIGAGLSPAGAGLGAPERAALLRGLRDGPARVAARRRALEAASVRAHHGWVIPGPRTGHAGTDYLTRAVTASVGLWANTPAEAMYPLASRDSAGRQLTGAHRYVLRFAPGALPPVSAFWSLTMYQRALRLVANPLGRYALGDRSGLRRDADGGLTIRLQHAAPHGDQANWLPAPAGRFTVTLRLYRPRPAALRGTWQPPGIRRVA